LAAGHGLVFVVRTKIAEDASASGIGGANLPLAVEKAIKLIKIHGLGDVGGDECVVFAPFLDAIHLNRQDHGHAVLFELASELDGF